MRTKRSTVDHDATIVVELMERKFVLLRDVQYQNASIWGRLITNFAGPMNNFILSIVVYSLLALCVVVRLTTTATMFRWHPMGRFG